MDVLCNSTRSTDRSNCPYDINIEIKPGLAHSLDSLESGRLILTVRLRDGADVQRVWARLFNNARRNRLHAVEGGSALKTKTSVLAALVKQPRSEGSNNLDVWLGEIGIPISWTEGASSSIERTGSFTQTETEDLFTLEISYFTTSGDRCSARLVSQDAYHWPST